MNTKVTEIQRNWYDLLKECTLSTMDMWKIEEEISDILFDKGYGLINFTIAPCRYGKFNALTCETNIANELSAQIKEAGFKIVLTKNPSYPSETWIILPYNLTVELRDHVGNFKVIS